MINFFNISKSLSHKLLFSRSRIPVNSLPFRYNRRALTILLAGNGGDRTNEGRSSHFHRWSWLCALPVVGIFMGNVLGNPAENCGIVGVVGTDDASGFLLEGLVILRNRGYDSAGMASVPSDGSHLCLTKFASRESTSDSIDLLRANASKHVGHHIGVAHTRWATHGGKTDENAHPHTDFKGRVAIVHNGTINNSYELKKELQGLGISFRSETDTEVIAHLIGLYLDKGHGTRDAVELALRRFV